MIVERSENCFVGVFIQYFCNRLQCKKVKGQSGSLSETEFIDVISTSTMSCQLKKEFTRFYLNVCEARHKGETVRLNAAGINHGKVENLSFCLWLVEILKSIQIRWENALKELPIDWVLLNIEFYWKVWKRIFYFDWLLRTILFLSQVTKENKKIEGNVYEFYWHWGKWEGEGWGQGVEVEGSSLLINVSVGRIYCTIFSRKAFMLRRLLLYFMLLS